MEVIILCMSLVLSGVVGMLLDIGFKVEDKCFYWGHIFVAKC